MTMASMDSGLNRRDVLKLGSAGALLGLVSPACTTAPSGQASETSDFAELVRAEYEANGKSLLACAIRYLPELQVAPQPVSGSAVEERLWLARALHEELSTAPVDDIVATAFPMMVRYPAWLATAVSLELLEVTLAQVGLYDFELHGIAMEHLDPYFALVDMAVLPACEVLHSADRAVSTQVETALREQIDALWGRVRLFGDHHLLAITERLPAVLAHGSKAPVVMRVFGEIAANEAAPLRVDCSVDTPNENDVLWRLEAGRQAWEQTIHIVREDIRTINKVVNSLLLGRLFLRCTYE